MEKLWRLFLLYVRTLRHLRPRQLLARLPHEWWVRRRKKLGWPEQRPDVELKFNKVHLSPPPPDELARLRAVAAQWQKGIVEYLGQQGAAADYRAWHRPRLWRYERHYHSEPVAFAAMALEEPAGPWLEAARDLIVTWAAEAPPQVGESWEPYPTARRLLNWSEAVALDPRVGGPLAFRMQVQIAHLLAHLEHHLRGNHLICDAAALIAAGSVLQGPGAAGALHQGIVLLEKELAAQVLPDGGYAERTVLYHSLVLRDATLALQLGKERGQPPSVKNELGRMALWLAKVRRADGSFPQVNDSSPSAQLVAADALRRAIKANLVGPLPEPATVIDLPDTGWTFLREGGCELFFDRGPIGPVEQPGHGHAGSLAYELQWYGLPVVCDSGMTTYEASPVRDFERSAAAHATVSVDGEGVDEVWHSFRVARRGRVERLPDPQCDARLRGLRGRAVSFRGWEHERWVFFWPGRALLVFDRLGGVLPEAQVRVRGHIPLHHTWSVAETGKVFYLLGPGARGLQLQVLRGELDGAPHGQETPRDGWMSLGFNQPVARTSVRLRPDAQGLMAHAFFAPGVSWREAPGGIALRAPGAEVLLKLEGGLPA